MASGVKHEETTKRYFIPFGVIIGILLGMKSGVLGSIGFLIGGLWLSPDLDTNSIALKRWGPLAILWWPYQRAIPHRSFLSHGPLIGTIIRLIYCSSLVILIAIIAERISFSNEIISLDFLIHNIQINRSAYCSFLIGIEASAWLHLIEDRYPLQIKLRRWWNR